jgi:hypothetical protein
MLYSVTVYLGTQSVQQPVLKEKMYYMFSFGCSCAGRASTEHNARIMKKAVPKTVQGGHGTYSLRNKCSTWHDHIASCPICIGFGWLNCIGYYNSDTVQCDLHCSA